MSWFDTPDSWWDKEHETEISGWGRRTDEVWDFNRNNVPEEYHWPSRLRASFTTRVQGEQYNNAHLYFTIIAAVVYDHVWGPDDSDQVVLKLNDSGSKNLRSGGLYELIHVDLELPIEYSTFSASEYRFSVRAAAVATGYNANSYMTHAEIHNIQFLSSAFWQKHVNTYEE